jgi:diguanylate cyclase (GGDEF)-like protein
MRLIDRKDTPLVIGLIAGTAVMFAQPFRSVLSIAEEVAATYRVDLIPGFVVFVLVCSLHFWRKYRDTVAAAELQSVREQDALRRSRDLDQLVAASHAIANTLDAVALRVQVQLHVPALLGGRKSWVALTGPLGWEWVLEPEEFQDELLDQMTECLSTLEAGEEAHGMWALRALRHGDRTLGVLGVDRTVGPTKVEESLLAALAAVLGVAIKNGQLFAELQARSTTDALTGCINRAHGLRTLGTELRRAQRTGSPLSVLMLDVDGFKEINDEHGHVEGDRLLAAIGATLQRALRTTDVKCRYGGDEFLIILPDTPEHAAHHVADHLRQTIVRVEVPGSNSRIACQVSVGVGVAASGELDPVAVVRRADKELYENKQARKPRTLTPAFGQVKPAMAVAADAAR